MNQNKFNEFRAEHVTDIKDYLYRIVANWKWFLLALFIAFGIAYYYNISTQKIFGLKTTIAVKEKQNPLFATGTNIAFNWGGVSDKVENIRKALTSRTHNEKVVKALQLYVNYYVDGRFRKEDIYGGNPFTLKLQTNQFQLINLPIIIEFNDESHFLLTVNFEDVSSAKLMNYENESIKKYVPENKLISKSFSLNEYINEPFLKGEVTINDKRNIVIGKKYYVKLSTVNAVTNTFKNLRAKGLSGTSLIEVSLTGANKSKLVDYLNRTVAILAKDQLNEKTNYARSTKAFIDAQFKNTSDSLKLIEDSIGKFKKKNAIYDLS
ncbi:MAG: Wzz/FepE/Etk N-terminal domain-containing protein, partial [Lutibacter sp.]